MWIRPEGDGTLLVCRIHPNARKDSIDGPRQDALSIHLNAPAVEGKANKALVQLLAKKMRIAKSKIAIRTGEKGKTKVLAVSGLAPREVAESLGLSLPPSRRDTPAE
ncbi:MAG: hypothetical protein BWZ01_02667 [Deltaproteobacteria bacterium ADurb.BinA179]|jgi:hypothetical protein|nr:DUF167 domain-containing protein [Deltaproteobacteria bacterium]MDI9541275.1 DUF167 domain-containing protein [Pseudomonadota bacterium]NLW66528.1 DUF167 domain-containing protein [Bacteriovoracaceae bacterium]OPZ25042.1 MAG: hypothetical protein BWZ01_02667 [Deltaproteobacteria bacterium ADurb.BinA179]HRR22333.1 DUF167 domain-containing protein [Desulfomonilia bacterium]